MSVRSRTLTTTLVLTSLVTLGLPVLQAQAAVPLCWGKPATIVGTPGNDVLIGRDTVSDVIWGGGGDDVIYGAADWYDPGTAPDLLCGERGNDRVIGSAGNDKINGGDGNDVVDGARGNDTVQGNAGNDRIEDRSFADMDQGNDLLKGGIGDDVIYIALGLDKAYGEAGNDRIIDLECSKTSIYGGPGNDYIESVRSSYMDYPCSTSASKDVIHGEGNTDTVVANKVDSVLTAEKVTRLN